MTENEPTLKLGDQQFKRLMLVLKAPITQANHLDYRFEDSALREIQPEIWAMPAYLQTGDDFALFFLITKIESGETVVAFAQGTWQEGSLKLNEPLTTGAGLNLLNGEQPQRAARVLKFLTDISRADEGQWRQIDDE